MITLLPQWSDHWIILITLPDHDLIIIANGHGGGYIIRLEDLHWGRIQYAGWCVEFVFGVLYLYLFYLYLFVVILSDWRTCIEGESSVLVGVLLSWWVVVSSLYLHHHNSGFKLLYFVFVMVYFVFAFECFIFGMVYLVFWMVYLRWCILN